MGCTGAQGGMEKFQALLSALQMEMPAYSEENLVLLTAGVNPERMKNFPISLDSEVLHTLYRGIMNKKD